MFIEISPVYGIPNPQSFTAQKGNLYRALGEAMLRFTDDCFGRFPAMTTSVEPLTPEQYTEIIGKRAVNFQTNSRVDARINRRDERVTASK